MNMKKEDFKILIRQALANYIASEGCGCCENYEMHREAAAELAELLDVPKHDGGSGYDFLKFKRK